MRNRGPNPGLLAAMAAAALLALPPAMAQGEKKDQPPLVSVSVKDADLRDTLVSVFQQTKTENYVIAPEVRGFLTLSLKDRPLDAVLNLIARVASPPLAWSKTDGVYAVRVRTGTGRVSDADAPALAAPVPSTQDVVAAGDESRVEVIRLMYADARDIAAALGAIRPPDLKAAVAYTPNNQLITSWGPGAGRNGFVGGALGNTVGIGFGSGFGPRFSPPTTGPAFGDALVPRQTPGQDLGNNDVGPNGAR